jgi:uncharacterized protein (DUF2062 family)
VLGKLRNASDVARPVEQVSPGSARRWTRWRDLRSLRGIEATPHAIAAGFAAGIAVSLSPLIGLHFVLGAALALLTRGNLLASALGTLVANPWTFPAIWLATYQVGAVLLPEHSAGQIGTETFERTAQGLAASILSFDLSLLATTMWPLWLSMLIGSIPLGLIAWAATYGTLRWLLRSR